MLERYQHNRFVRCPLQVALRAEELGDFGNATAELRRDLPTLERDAAIDLIVVSDFLYRSYVGAKQ